MHFNIPFVLSILLSLCSARRNHTHTLRPRAKISSLLRRGTGEVVTGAAAVSSVNDNDGGTANPSFSCYYGTGASGWPGQSEWVSFESMWSGLLNNGLGVNCYTPSGYSTVIGNSGQETQDVRSAIENIAGQSQVDHRFILAIIMNESSGCVRVPTTHPNDDDSIFNPGLMQDYDGRNTCNCDVLDEYGQGCGQVQPCPSGTISGMIEDGTMGTSGGSGLAGLINNAQSGAQTTGAQTFYHAAGVYNQGSVSGDLPFYSVKVANWLVGWQGAGAPSHC